MSRRRTIFWTVSPHAKQRAWERYGVMFSPQTWSEFCTTLQKEKHSIFLGCDRSGSCRFVCYFQQRWFLIGGNTNGSTGVIATFLPDEALSEEDKLILRSHDRYCQIGHDRWNIGDQVFPFSIQREILMETQILPEELPEDFDQVDKLFEKEFGVLKVL